MVDVIVPVYKGVSETRECLERLRRFSQRTPFEVILINDASPEPGMAELLSSYATEVGFALLANEENLGFVKSVNRGLALHPDRDAVLLNSDAMVSGDWLDRLVSHLKPPQVASVTPFSNNASICSYPDLEGRSDWPEGMESWDHADAVFARLGAGSSSPIPVGVGFCMALKRTVLGSCGAFNEELFGTGYGEEVEWCLRTRRAGFEHRIAHDVFVGHLGSVSFGNAHRLERLRVATEILERLYPEWQGILQSYLLDPPDQAARRRVDLFRALSDPRPRIIHMLHSSGGGIEAHIRDLQKAEAAWSHWTLRQEGQVVILAHADFQVRLSMGPSTSLEELCERLGAARVHLHHLMKTPTRWLDEFKLLEPEKRVTLHDFFLFCPQVNLLDEKDAFCDVPPVEACEKCVRLKQPNYPVASVRLWKDRHGDLLRSANQILAPTPSVKALYLKAYPDLEEKIRVVGHPDLLDPVPDPYPGWPREVKALNLLLMGTLDKKKGLEFVEGICRESGARAGLDIQVFHTGPKVSSLGKNRAYRWIGPEGSLESIRSQCEEFSIHATWFPSQCPETYGYALSRGLRLGLPIVATRLGAFADRLRDLSGVELVEYGRDPRAVLEQLAKFKERYAELRDVAPRIRAAFLERIATDAFWKREIPAAFGSRKTLEETAEETIDLEKASASFVHATRQEFSVFASAQGLWLRLRSSPRTAWMANLVPKRLVAGLKRGLMGKQP